MITDDMVETGCRAYMKAMHESFSPDHSIFEGGEPNWKLYIDGVRAILETLPKREYGGQPMVIIKTTDLRAHVQNKRGDVRVQFAFYENHDNGIEDGAAK